MGAGGRRRALWLVLLAVLAAAATGLWLYRNALVGAVLRAGIDRMGLGPSAVTVERFGLDSARLTGGRLGPSVAFRSADLAFSPGDLWHGRIDSAVIEGLALSAHIGPDGLAIDGLESLFPADGAAARTVELPSLPFGHLVLKDFRLTLRGAGEPIRISGDAAVDVEPEGAIRASVTAAVASPKGSAQLAGDMRAAPLPSGGIGLALDLAATGDLTGIEAGLRGNAEIRYQAPGTVEGTVRLDRAAVANEAAAAEGLHGTVSFAIRDGRLRSVQGDLALDQGRIADLPVRHAALRLDYGPDGLSADAALAWAGGELAAQAAAADPGAPVQFAAHGRIDAGWLHDRLMPAGDLQGRVGVTASGRIGDLSGLAQIRDLGSLLDSGDFQAALDVRLESLSLPSVGAAERAGGLLRIETDGRQMRLTAPNGLSAEGVRLDREVLADLPAEAAALLGQPLRIEFAGRGADRPFMLTLRPDGAGIAVGGALSAKLRGKGLDLGGAAEFAVDLDEGFAPQRIAVPEAALSFTDLPLGGLRASGTVLLREVGGAPEALSGKASLDLALGGRLSPSVRLGGAELSAAGAFRLDSDGFLLDLEEASHVRLKGIEAGAVRAAGPIALRLAPGEDARIAFDPATGALTAALAFRPADATLRIARGTEPPVEVRVAARKIGLAWREDGATGITVAGGRLTLPQYALAADQVRLNLDLAPDGSHAAELHAGELRQLTDPPAVIPLTLQLTAKGTGARSVLRGELFDSARRLVVRIEGEHSLAKGRGRAALTMQPVTFLPTVLQPQELFPALSGLLGEVDGEIDAAATLSWGPEGLRSEGTLGTSIRKLAAYGAEIRDAAARIAFDSLAPLSTRPDQTVTFRLLNVGLPFTDGAVGFELRPDGTVTGRLRELHLFGGTIRTEPFAFDPQTARLHLVLKVEGVNLEQFLAFADYGDLSATGTLRGTIPVVITPGGVAIRNAVLTTGVDGGELHYRPRELGADLESTSQGTELLMKALEHFDYDSIRVEIDESPTAGMGLRLSIRGSSPNVYDSYPIVLNVNVSGPLGDILRRGLRTYQMPEELGRRLQEQGQ